MLDQIKAIAILVTLVVLWPVCAAAWLIQWPLVKWTLRTPRRRTSAATMAPGVAIDATPIATTAGRNLKG